VGTTTPPGSGAQRCAQAGEREHRIDSTAGTASGARHRRQRPEAAIQRAVFQHLRARAAPNVFAFHPANGGYRKPVEAAIMKGLGVVAGVPDVIVIHAGRCYALELKAEGGRVTDKQLATIAALREAGAFVGIAEGINRAIACLEAWGLLLGRSQ
jgi:VRR-NUC domain